MEKLPKIVQQGLRRAAKPDVHPDPDLLTAFAEKSLNGRERAQVLRHLAECGDCRELVSLATPEPQAAPFPGRQVSAWLSWPVLRWGALAACVVVVGAAVTLHYEGRKSEEASVAESSPEKPAASAAKSDVPQQTSGELAARVESPSALRLERDSGGAFGKPDVQREQKLAARTVPPARDQIRSTDQPAAPPPAAAAKAAEAEPRSNVRSDALDYTAKAIPGAVAVGNAVPAPMGRMTQSSDAREKVLEKDESSKNELHQEAQAAGAAAVAGAVLQDRKADTLAAETVAVSSGAYAKKARTNGNAPLWTLSADGVLQRSFDSGKTWQTIPVAGGVTFRALSANESDIWVGGSAGALYHSSDAGRHWIQIKPVADGKPLTSDIAKVEFSDPRHGKLTTGNQENGNGETWTTSDAGETWQRH